MHETFWPGAGDSGIHTGWCTSNFRVIGGSFREVFWKLLACFCVSSRSMSGQNFRRKFLELPKINIARNHDFNQVPELVEMNPTSLPELSKQLRDQNSSSWEGKPRTNMFRKSFVYLLYTPFRALWGGGSEEDLGRVIRLQSRRLVPPPVRIRRPDQSAATTVTWRDSHRYPCSWTETGAQITR